MTSDYRVTYVFRRVCVSLPSYERTCDWNHRHLDRLFDNLLMLTTKEALTPSIKDSILRKRLHIMMSSFLRAPSPEDLFLCSYLPVVKTFAGHSQTFLFALVEVHVTFLLRTTSGEFIFIFFPCAFCNKIHLIKSYMYYLTDFSHLIEIHIHHNLWLLMIINGYCCVESLP